MNDTERYTVCRAIEDVCGEVPTFTLTHGNGLGAIWQVNLRGSSWAFESLDESLLAALRQVTYSHAKYPGRAQRPPVEPPDKGPNADPQRGDEEVPSD